MSLGTSQMKRFTSNNLVCFFFNCVVFVTLHLQICISFERKTLDLHYKGMLVNAVCCKVIQSASI
jgi:hypothetical protein